MAERHALLNSRAISTLLDKEDRVSRITDGYGDFSFAPKGFNCLNCYDPLRRPSAGLPLDEELEALSISDGAVHSTPPRCSFLALPRDVRDLIYQHWLAPFRNPWDNNRIKVHIGVVYDRRCHPFRNGYSMTVPVSVVSEDIDYRRETPHYHLKPAEYEQLVSLSQTCKQVRAELGDLFWSEVYVDIDHWEYLFVDFLSDRPSTWAGIKKLRMVWACEDRATDLNDGWGSIVEFCEFVKDKLHLEEILFNLETCPRVVREILALGDSLKWVRAFRGLKVDKLSVKLSLCHDKNEGSDMSNLSDGDDDYLDSDSEDEEDAAALQAALDYLAQDEESALSEDYADDDEEQEAVVDAASAGSMSGAETPSESSSSASSENEDDEDDDDLDSLNSEEVRGALEAEFRPLVEALLHPAAPVTVVASVEDEYLAERRTVGGDGSKDEIAELE